MFVTNVCIRDAIEYVCIRDAIEYVYVSTARLCLCVCMHTMKVHITTPYVDIHTEAYECVCVHACVCHLYIHVYMCMYDTIHIHIYHIPSTS